MEELIKQLASTIQTGHFSLLFLAISFFGGVIASLSPCSLGILPIIVGYVGGYTRHEGESALLSHTKTFTQLLFFVLGLSAVLTVIGIICALTGKVFMAIGGVYWVLIVASLILVMGLNLLGLLELPMPVIVKQMPKSNGQSLFLYPFIVGALFALAATPCSTPILAGIMSFATLSQNMLYAALMLFLFALGQGVIIILVGISASFIKEMRSFSKYSSVLLKISGVLLVLASFLLYYKVFSRFFL